VLSLKEIEDEEAKVAARLSELTEAELSYVETLASAEVRDPAEFKKRLKGFFFGWHHFYLNDWIRGSISVALFAYALIGIFVMNIWFPAAIVLVYWLFELTNFLHAERKIRDRNVSARRSAIGQLKRRH
jgi:hypothetical protein